MTPIEQGGQDLLCELTSLLSRCCGPLFFADSSLDPRGIQYNGTYTLVDTGLRKLIVTNAHVWTGLQFKRKEIPSLMLAAGVRRIKPIIIRNEPIDYDERLDLAVFETGSRHWAINLCTFVKLRPALLPSLTMGDRIFAMGFPGSCRRVIPGGIESVVYAYALTISSVTDPTFRCDMRKATNLDPLVNGDSPYRGASGGPCFLFKGDTSHQLVGIIKEFGMEQLSFISTARINADGTIRRD